MIKEKDTSLKPLMPPVDTTDSLVFTIRLDKLT